MMSPSELKFLKICQKRGYFPKGSKVLIALSGGKDSMTLFNWLYDSQEKLGITLAVAHINHKVRAESDQEEALLAEKMGKLEIPFHLATFEGKFSETLARNFRYNFFAKLMETEGYDILVTAHHKDDQAETIFMRLLTGRRMYFLTGIADCQDFATGKLIRPLLDFQKGELEAADYFEDYTNQENEHLRNRIRNIYLPELSQENPQFASSLLDLADEISKSKRIINQQISHLNIISEKIDLQLFKEQTEDLQFFILQEYFRRFPDFQIGKVQFSEVLQIIQRNSQYRSQLTKDYHFVKDSKSFYLTKALNGASRLEILAENPNDPEYLAVNLPKGIDFQVRNREQGDSIRIQGTHKSLKKYFIDQKISLEDRDSNLIAVGSEVYAVAALGLTSDLSNDLESAKIKQTIWVKVHKNIEEIEDA